MRKFLTSVAIVFTLSGTAQAQDGQKGLAAARAGDFETALQEWRPLAEQGDEWAGENRDNLAKRMTREAIEKAQAMARKCMSSNYQNCGD